MNARPERREALWRATRNSDGSQDNELRIALMQSLPDHSGYDPAAARRRLQNLLAHEPQADVAGIARLRLAELKTADACSDEQTLLRQRLAKMVEIERTLYRKQP